MSDVIAKEQAEDTPRGPPRSVTEKRMRGRDGKNSILRTVDAASPTFGEDMLYVFRKNVEAARRENKRILGVADVEPRKR